MARAGEGPGSDGPTLTMIAGQGTQPEAFAWGWKSQVPTGGKAVVRQRQDDGGAGENRPYTRATGGTPLTPGRKRQGYSGLGLLVAPPLFSGFWTIFSPPG